ncbi:alpha/beta hydrolase [Jeotgalibacillus salarius]|uniref:Alpha/beta hydrolase n=1 Tax=Jeotgalibacillus salarius TaxID=546023 RepID=A0A4Y8LKT7_9BACL|nr:alpha/beta hydrolase [Jeotgalibacillus salarius]TFE02389.1 alpha/beta hydrolase [Jeotgalibacillus salarius]
MNVNKNVADTTKYTHIHSGSDTVCFMFSGAGYTYDKPLFYYSTMLMLEKKIDIVQVHYSFKEDVLKKPMDELIGTMMNDVNPVLSVVLDQHDYQHVIFLGKSLGTIPIACDLMQRELFADAKMILLTPLLKLEPVLEGMLYSEHEQLLVIGGKDPHYNNEQLLTLGRSGIHTSIIPEGNHSLDTGLYDTKGSLKALMDVMMMVKRFLDE